MNITRTDEHLLLESVELNRRFTIRFLALFGAVTCEMTESDTSPLADLITHERVTEHGSLDEAINEAFDRCEQAMIPETLLTNADVDASPPLTPQDHARR